MVGPENKSIISNTFPSNYKFCAYKLHTLGCNKSGIQILNVKTNPTRNIAIKINFQECRGWELSRNKYHPFDSRKIMEVPCIPILEHRIWQ